MSFPCSRNYFQKRAGARTKDVMLGILYIYDRVEKDVGRGYGWRFNENIKNFETLRSMLYIEMDVMEVSVYIGGKSKGEKFWGVALKFFGL